MKTEQDTKIEQLELELSEMRDMLQAKSEKKPSKTVIQLKESWNRFVLNIIDDLPTTAAGVGSGIAVLALQWPNIDPSDIANAVGLGGLGAASNGKKAPKPTIEDNYYNDTEELG